METIELNPVNTFMVSLLYKDEPVFDADKLINALKKDCGGIGVIANDPGKKLYSFAFLDHPIQLADALITAQGAILPTKGVNKQDYAAAVQQSWHLENAQAIIDRTNTVMVVSEMMSAPLEIKTRLKLFQKFLVNVIEVTNCIGIYWPHSQKILDPQLYVKSLRKNFEENFLEGLVNVRMFKVGDGGYGETLMDTTGLNAIGLADLQIHFTNIEPGNVAAFLSGYSKYVYEKGDVLNDGCTVDGFDPGSKWLCNRQVSLAGPERIVVNVKPTGKYLPIM